MPKQEAPILQLQDYLPEGSFDEVVFYLQQYKVHLTISRQRQSILGDYRHAHSTKNHRISVNGNLNKYSFLITLLHELAHLFTFEKYGNKVQSHGREWKDEFSKILARFLSKKIFPADIQKALLNTLQNPAASSCGDEKLLRVLHNYDEKEPGVYFVEQIPEGATFVIKGDRVFKKGEKIRKRFKCVEIKTGKYYLFSAVYEVKLASA
jgi:predicted SprT family Zn-dependent metalloprotease